MKFSFLLRAIKSILNSHPCTLDVPGENLDEVNMRRWGDEVRGEKMCVCVEGILVGEERRKGAEMRGWDEVRWEAALNMVDGLMMKQRHEGCYHITQFNCVEIEPGFLETTLHCQAASIHQPSWAMQWTSLRSHRCLKKEKEGRKEDGLHHHTTIHTISAASLSSQFINS